MFHHGAATGTALVSVLVALGCSSTPKHRTPALADAPRGPVLEGTAAPSGLATMYRISASGSDVRFAGWTPQSQAILEQRGQRWLVSPPSGDLQPATAAPPELPSWTPRWAAVPWEMTDGTTAYLSASRRARALPSLRSTLPCDEAIEIARERAAPKIVYATRCPSSTDELIEEANGEFGTREALWGMHGEMQLGWFHARGWLVEALSTEIILRDATGVTRTSWLVRNLQHNEDPPRFWNLALSSDGTLLAVIWRRHDYGVDTIDIEGPASATSLDCLSDGERCRWEYFVELWFIGEPSAAIAANDDWPKRLWRERLTATPVAGQPPNAKRPSGPMQLDLRGQRLLVAFSDGDVLVRPLRAPARDDRHASEPVFSVHRHAITLLELSPDAQWAYTEDDTSERRLWKLPAPQAEK